jgi:1-acyl-sn-glycerol-3-phosphate acyltransferase
MTGNLRLIARLIALALLTAAMYGVRLASMPFTLPFPNTDRRWRRCLFRHWARWTVGVFGMRITVNRVPPRPPFFLVMNHLTYLDGLAVASRIGCVFIAKSEVAKWPLIGFLARQVNVIFIVREKRHDTIRVNDRIKSEMDKGEGVIMFAESTTSRGLAVQPFKTALFEAAVRHQFPVHYAAIYYRTPPGAPPASEWVTWWTPISFGAHLLRVLRGPGFTAVLTFGEEPISGTDRKVLARQLHDAVQRDFIPVE